MGVLANRNAHQRTARSAAPALNGARATITAIEFADVVHSTLKNPGRKISGFQNEVQAEQSLSAIQKGDLLYKKQLE
ncbi:hypothetical protein EVAR_8035_1 [Eumeta japonica]|uniref:Uncharacterized protein n=1 Tax=Eumeta variegata TaxID=151549 RepID=A0A4C1TKI5_EUMVA|nr:hypothetical protein EVAR_8035_1 [Eumeta japonica]